jgi:hypothetical protein
MATDVMLDHVGEAVRKLLYEEYDRQGGGRRLAPRYPYLLVRVLPKEYKVGSLFIPDLGKGSQSKPNYEGVVLEVWQPWVKTLRTSYGDPDVADSELRVQMQSVLAVGDHVMFPHWAGYPAGFLDAEKYRLVREDTSDDLGHVVAKFEYEKPDLRRKIQERIVKDIAAHAYSSALIPDSGEVVRMLDIVEEEAYLVPRQTGALMQTGKSIE